MNGSSTTPSAARAISSWRILKAVVADAGRLVRRPDAAGERG
jgi:hypothetical protein